MQIINSTFIGSPSPQEEKKMHKFQPGGVRECDIEYVYHKFMTSCVHFEK